jgi:proteasome lid subunit RPN8/RPN11
VNRLAEVQRLLVPSSIAQGAHAHLQRVGRRQVEGVALWAGQIDGHDARITTTIIPQQTALRLPTGLIYIVNDEELHRLNVRLYREGLTLVAQLHSHPEDAYHSDTDDTYPIATAVGSISVVVPGFARGTIDTASWAVYRLTAQGWTAMTERQISSFIQVLPD